MAERSLQVLYEVLDATDEVDTDCRYIEAVEVEVGRESIAQHIVPKARTAVTERSKKYREMTFSQGLRSKQNVKYERHRASPGGAVPRARGCD